MAADEQPTAATNGTDDRRTAALFVRIPKRLHDALTEAANVKGTSLVRLTTDLLTAALVAEELPSVLPGEVQSYLAGRRMFAMITGLLEAAGEARSEVEEIPDPPTPKEIARAAQRAAEEGGRG